MSQSWEQPTNSGEHEPPRQAPTAASSSESTPASPPLPPVPAAPPLYAAPSDDAQAVGASGAPSLGSRLNAVSGLLATIAFFVLGFATGGWAWAWIVFLVPGLVHRWNNPHD